MKCGIAIVIGFLARSLFAGETWPMLKGGAEHTGFLKGEIHAPYHLAWALEFEGERMGTAVEPIIGDGKVFIPTHAGNLYAIDASSGEVSWRFQASGPFLQSPACMGDVVVAASADGRVYALKADSGELLWSFDGPAGGFSASPIIAGKSVFVGSRSGNFYAMALENGKELWRAELGIPIRQTAAIK